MSTTRTLRAISREIRDDWGSRVSPSAAPYLDAMSRLGGIDEWYLADDARDIVLRFLCNARGWRGETARRVKAELRAMSAGGTP